MINILPIERSKTIRPTLINSPATYSMVSDEITHMKGYIKN